MGVIGKKKLAQETGEEIPLFLHDVSLHQGIAKALFWLGISTILLQSNISSLKVQPFLTAPWLVL
jgi:hypothetical protein